MTSNRIDVISMGCSKNLVDSERLMRRLEAKGYEVCHDSDNPCGGYVVVNTCGFINDAKEESINMILELGQLKRSGRIGRIVVMGCLSQRYMDELHTELPEVDIWYGKFDWKNFIDTLPDIGEGKRQLKEWERKLTTPPSSAYIKISEGCNRFCAFCAIPLITGRHTSRPVEEILEEVRHLVREGVVEFNVIAQDLSSYGVDLYGESRLAALIDSMADIEGVEWIRLHYAYPADFPYDVLEVMRRRQNVCKYLDIALQHIADPVLSNMRRHIDKEKTLELIDRIRSEVPGIFLRTTLMVGFPGEGDAEFEQLLEFVRNVKFERMGAFAYCEEDDTWAARNLNDDTPDEVKRERLQTLMDLQESISEEVQARFAGKRIKVLVDHFEGATAVCRSEFDSPGVDPEILIENCKARPGDFIIAEIMESYPFELMGKEVNEL